MKKLIITADDFGLTPGINKAICECAAAKKITATSAMPTGMAFDEIKQFIIDYPHIEIGLHFDLVSDKLSTNLQPEKNVFKLYLRTLYDKKFLFLIEKELRAQLEKLMDIVSPKHIDSHRHLHFLPAIFKIVQKVADEYAINRIRIPLPKLTPQSLKFLFKRRDFFKYLPFYIWRLQNHTNAASMDDFFGLFQTGAITNEYLDFVVNSNFEYAELMVHPGYVDEFLKKQNETLLYKRERELKILLNYDFKK